MAERPNLGRPRFRPRFYRTDVLVPVIGATVLALLGVVVQSGRLSLPAAAAATAVAACSVVAVTLSTRSLWNVLFFLLALNVTLPQRLIYSVDLVSFAALAVVLMIILRRRLDRPPESAVRMGAGEAFLKATLGAFGAVLVLTGIINGVSVDYVPWVIGIVVVGVVLSLPVSELPSARAIRRSVTIAMTVSLGWDLFFLATGRGFDVGTFNGGRFGGSINDYELLAEYYGAAIFLAMVAFTLERGWAWRALASLLAAGSVTVIIATQSRAPVLLLAVVIPVFLAALILARGYRLRGLVAASALAIAAIYAYETLAETTLFARIGQINFGADIDLATTLNRQSTWDYFSGLQSFRDTGLLGNGLSYPYEQIGTYPHSLYLWLAWSTGYLGVAAFLAFVSSIAVPLIKSAYRRNIDSLVVGLLGAYLLIDQIIIEAVRTPVMVSLVWAILAFAVIALRQDRSRS